MIQERFAYLDKLRQEHPERFFEKIASIAQRWRMWKKIVHVMHEKQELDENQCADLEQLIAYFHDDFVVMFE